MDDAIAELEGMRKAAEADEVATVQLRKRLVGLQGTLTTTRCDPCYPTHSALCPVQFAVCMPQYTSAPGVPIW